MIFHDRNVADGSTFQNLYRFMKNNDEYSAKMHFEIGDAVHLFKFELSEDNVITGREYLAIGHFGFMNSEKIEEKDLKYPYTLVSNGKINHLGEFYYLTRSDELIEIQCYASCRFSEYEFWQSQKLFSAAEFNVGIKKRLDHSIKLWMVMNV